MNTKKNAMFAIPVFAVLIAVGAVYGNISNSELSSNSENSSIIQNQIIPQAYAEKPNFQVLNATQLGVIIDPEFINTVECKVKMNNTVADSEFMWCYFDGEISIPAAIAAIAQVPPQEILSFTSNVIQANSVADSFIGFVIFEALNAQIEAANSPLELPTPNGFEAELHTICEDLDLPDPTCETTWKVKEMWG